MEEKRVFDLKNGIQRNCGVDLLKIVSMFLVVMLHVLGQGGLLPNAEPLSAKYMMVWFLEACALCAVNCYAMISGYVGFTARNKKSNIIYLAFQVIFYVVVFSVAGYFLYPDANPKMLIQSLLDLFFGGYWYFTSYFCAFFFFPYLNSLIEKLDEKALRKLCITLFVVLSVVPTFIRENLIGGYSVCWLLVAYTFGATIRKLGLEKGKRVGKSLALFLLFAVVTWGTIIGIAAVTQKLTGKIQGIGLFVPNYSPLMVLMSYFLMMAFLNIRLCERGKRITAKLSPLTFGVYLIHTQYFVYLSLKNCFAGFLEMNMFGMIGAIFAATLGLFFVCMVIDAVRKALFDLLRIKNISEGIEALFHRN